MNKALLACMIDMLCDYTNNSEYLKRLKVDIAL